MVLIVWEQPFRLVTCLNIKRFYKEMGKLQNWVGFQKEGSFSLYLCNTVELLDLLGGTGNIFARFSAGSEIRFLYL